MSKLSRMGRTVFRTSAQEQAAIKLAAEFSKIFETYIDPYSLVILSARGYWSHMQQDVMRFNGHYNGNPRFDFGSWELTVSDVARKKIKIIDDRASYRPYVDFDIQPE